MEVARAVESTADEEGLVVPVGTGSQLAGRRADVEVEGARASIATSKAFAMLGGGCRSFTRSEPTRAASSGGAPQPGHLEVEGRCAAVGEREVGTDAARPVRLEPQRDPAVGERLRARRSG